MKITDYAVYKDDKQPWTVDEVTIIARTMGDFSLIEVTTYKTNKFCYYREGESYPWNSQDISDKTPISYTDYLKLITPTKDNIKVGSKVLIVDKWVHGCYPNEEGKMDKYLNTIVTISDVSQSKYYGIVCSIEEDSGTWTWHLPSFKCLVLPEVIKPTNGIPLCWHMSRQAGKSISIDSMIKLKDLLKQEKPMTNLFEQLLSPRKGKYLSLKINNGQANVRSLIHQAHATGIDDPRPYIKSLISAEMKRLKQEIAGLDLDTIQYGFDVRLATLVNASKKLQQDIYNAPDTSITHSDCTHIYKLLDEVAILKAKQQAATDLGMSYIDPYAWIAPYLTPANLNIPKAKTLFISNKFHIYIKDGYVGFEDFKTETRYKAEIKLDVASNTYYI